jgi:hypothetical protein
MRANLKGLIALFVFSAVGSAAAQTVHKPAASATPANGSTGATAQRIAAIAPPPTVIVVPNNGVFFAPSGAFLANIPVIALPDGRVFADFGRGFEQIVRGCGSGTAFVTSVLPAPAQPAVIQPAVVQPPVVVTQPVPYNPPIAGQQIVSQPLNGMTGAQVIAGQSTIINPGACWALSERGQVFVFRP